MPRLRLAAFPPLVLRRAKTMFWRCFALTAALCTASVAQAAFTIVGTRVVYEDAQGEANVRVRYSVGETPVLMQAWLDDGDPESQPGTQDVPFIMNPAVARMTPRAEQIIRILRVGDLPSERETLFFFNVLEVLPDADSHSDADESFVHLNMQARLKFFYRPKGLQPAPQRAVESLRFSAEPPGADGSLRLRVENPTPYYFTLGQLTLHASDSAPALAELDSARELDPMVAPHSAMTVYMKADGARLPAQAQVRYTWINDQGGYVSQQGRLN